MLVPRFSSIKSRRDVDCGTYFTREIKLKLPFVSSNMDTEARMAIAVAEFGGLGVIHQFLPIDAQVREVLRVKRFQSRIIDDPHTISPDARPDIGDGRGPTGSLKSRPASAVAQRLQPLHWVTRDLGFLGFPEPLAPMSPKISLRRMFYPSEGVQECRNC